MKKLIILTLALTMVFSMVACGCNHQWKEATCLAPKTCTACGETEGKAADHTPGQLQITAVDTDKLTITHELACTVCSEVIETKESATGIAPVDGVMPLSPTEWFKCFSTNINLLGANQTLVPFTVESEDNALVHAVMSFNGFKAACTFWDAAGNVITTDQQDQHNLVKTIHLEAQFSNEAAADFYQALMIIAITNNSAMEPTAANELAQMVMGFETVADNGYLYGMEILSKEDQTVSVTITVE